MYGYGSFQYITPLFGVTLIHPVSNTVYVFVLRNICGMTLFMTVWSSTVHKHSTDARLRARDSLFAILLISMPSRDDFSHAKCDVRPIPQLLAERCIRSAR
jgi:hypothetical protein